MCCCGLVLIPGLFPDPAQFDPRVGPDLDGGRLRRGHRLLDRLHQVLCVADKHLRRFNILLSSWRAGV